MAFADRLDSNQIGVIYYLTISGLPYVWSNAALPSAWDNGSGGVTIDSEDYEWSKSFVPGDGWDADEQRVDPWRGFSEPGELEFKIQLAGTQRDASGDALLNALTPGILRGNVAVLTSTLSDVATSMSVDSAAGWSNPSDAYCGLETIGHTTSGGTSLGGLTRGKYGSTAQYHFASTDELLETGAGGAYVAEDRPLVMEGRIVTLWVSTGTFDDDGSFVPFGSVIQSSEDRAVWSGEITDCDFLGGTSTAEITAEGLERLVSREVMTRFPRARAGAAISPAYLVQVDEASDRLSWIWAKHDQARIQHRNVRMQDSGGGDLTHGVYTVWELADHIAATINSVNGHPWSGSTTVTASVQVEVGGGGTRVVTVWIETDDTSADNDEWFLKAITQGSSLWRALGYTAEAGWSEHNDKTTYGDSYELTADRGLPALYLPSSNSAAGVSTSFPRKLFYSDAQGPDFDGSPGFFDDAGTAANGYAKVGDREIVEFNATGTVSTDIGSVSYIEIVGRHKFGSTSDEIYVEFKSEEDKRPELRQVIGFPPNTSWGVALAQLLCGGTGDPLTNGAYDQGWRGSGVYAFESLIDTESLVEVSQATDGIRRSICITEPTALSDIFASDLILSQAALVAGYDSDSSSFKLKAISLIPPLDSETVDHTIDLSNLKSQGLVYRMSDSKIVNQIRAENLGYDHARGESRENVTWKNATSIGTWGKKSPIKIDARNVGDQDEATQRIVSFAQHITALCGTPFLVLTIPVTRAKIAWLAKIGDVCSITHPGLPAQDGSGRGLSGLIGRIYGFTPAYRDPNIRGTLTIVAAGLGWRFGAFAPSAYCETVDTTSVANDTLICTERVYSFDGDLEDVSQFQAGWKVRLSERGDESTAEIREIDYVDPNDDLIVLTSGTTLSAPLIVTLADYDESGVDPDQLDFVHLSDDDGKLDKASGSDTAFYYL